MSDTATLTAELDALDTAISDRIAQLAAELRARVSVRICIKVDEERELAFGKAGGSWCFYVTNRGGDTPLLQCSRDWRLEMVEDGHLERLIESAATQISEMVPPRRAAVAKLDRLLKRARS